MPFNLSMGELLVLLVVSILLFGGRLPEVARTIGQTIASFKRGMTSEMSRLDLELRGRDVPPYNPAPHLKPKRESPAEGGGGAESESAAPAVDVAAPEPEPDAEQPSS